MKVISVDNHTLVVCKRAGLATQKNEQDSSSLEEEAKAWVKQTYNKPGAVFLEPIHRLDKPVSGLVLFARTSKALSRLQEQMRERKIEKSYLALVEGILPQQEGRLEHFLIHDFHHARVSAPSDPRAKQAILDYRVQETRLGMSFVQITLHTGRYHQIRAQFGAIGFPVCGDERYGSKKKSEAIRLHHFKLSYHHPITQALITAESMPDSSLFN
jgi:23S rRNA pseudouridine1911/1915/1917 synthase